MGFLPLKAKPGQKGKLRPILRKRWSEDELASKDLATNNAGRGILKGPAFLKNRFVPGGDTAGQQVPGSGLGGGEV